MKNFVCIMIGLISLSVILYAQNPAGMALSLDGDGDYADFGNNTQTNFDTSDFTIEYWINKSTTRGESVITKRETCMHSNFWSMRAGSTINIEIDQDQNATNYLNMPSLTEIADSNWHHVAVTRTEDNVSIYVDGHHDTTRSSGGTTNISNFASLLIGHGACVGSDGTLDFTGFIDEVRIWSVARTNAQIQSTMNDTLGPGYYSTADSGLVAYYRFDQLENLGIGGDGLTDDVRDLTGNNNHGDLVGDAILVPSGAFVGIEEIEINYLSTFALSQNYPNPFNPTTTIRFQIPNSQFITLKVYDLSGREAALLVNEQKPAGSYAVKFDANKLASGVYFYRLEAGEFKQIRKMLLVR